MSSPPAARSFLLLSLLAVLIGVVAGFGAWGFRLLIGLFHNLFFTQTFSATYDANVHTPIELGAWVILVPMIGGLGVVWLVRTFAPEAKGHGVPEVMDAIHYQDGRIRPQVVVVKSLASGLSIGSGGSVGREGPIIQIGAAFGSLLGQLIAMPARQRILLLAAGAGGGIAATFNAPLGGILFAAELLLISVNVWSILLVTVATVTATYIGRLLMGPTPAFEIPALQALNFAQEPLLEVIAMIPLGIVMGLAAAAFIRAIYWAEDWFDSLPGNDYTRHLLGMGCVGVIIYVLAQAFGHYYVQGVGYATIYDILKGILSDPLLLLLLFFLKFLATCLTLGSGASGGVFSPSLFMGATIGAAFGHVTLLLFPQIGIDVPIFAIAGMAAAISAGTGALFTSVIMVVEMTADHNILLPLLLCSATAYAVRKTICRPSIYTLKLIRRGHPVPEGLLSADLEARRISDIMRKDVDFVTADDPSYEGRGVAIMLQGDDVSGAVCHISQTGPEKKGAMSHVVLPPETPLASALRTLANAGADVAIVSSSPSAPRRDNVLGVVSAEEIMAEMKSHAQLI